MKSLRKQIATHEQEISRIKNQQALAWKREDTYSLQVLTDRLYLTEHRLKLLKDKEEVV